MKPGHVIDLCMKRKGSACINGFGHAAHGNFFQRRIGDVYRETFDHPSVFALGGLECDDLNSTRLVGFHKPVLSDGNRPGVGREKTYRVGLYLTVGIHYFRLELELLPDIQLGIFRMYSNVQIGLLVLCLGR